MFALQLELQSVQSKYSESESFVSVHVKHSWEHTLHEFNQQDFDYILAEASWMRMIGTGGWLGALQLSILCLIAARCDFPPAENVHLLQPEELKLVLNQGLQEFPVDCHEIWQTSGGQAWDGLYLIQPAGSLIVAYCAMQEGGWTVVQHITVNSTVDFDRTWDEYKLGFGALTGDHWLGNNYLHQLTSRPVRYELRVKLVDKDAVTKLGEYDPVLVEGEESQYRLRLGLFQGTAVDALTQDTENYLHDNQKFTTKDRDNDNYFQNCAQLEFQGVPGGGWWYDACAGANLNRRNVIYWQKDCNKELLCKYAWMMVKPSDFRKGVHSGRCRRDEL